MTKLLIIFFLFTVGAFLVYQVVELVMARRERKHIVHQLGVLQIVPNSEFGQHSRDDTRPR